MAFQKDESMSHILGTSLAKLGMTVASFAASVQLFSFFWVF